MLPKAPKAEGNPWKWPSAPWQRIHIDFAGPFLGENFLLVVDAHSKWPEVFRMKSITATSTIEKLRHAFASNGLPTELVSDNGRQFVYPRRTTRALMGKQNALSEHLKGA